MKRVVWLTPAAVEHGRFAVRCAVAASLAYLFAVSIGLPHPMWAPMSALIVSQESLGATQSSILGRFVGTLVGLLVAMLVHVLGVFTAMSLTVQIAVAVVACAVCAKERPAIRVCLWTAPLVLITTDPATAIEVTALFRGSEVVIGAAVGGLVHFADEWLLARLLRRLLRGVCHVTKAPGTIGMSLPRSEQRVSPASQ